jgi:hypothetical protein
LLIQPFHFPPSRRPTCYSRSADWSVRSSCLFIVLACYGENRNKRLVTYWTVSCVVFRLFRFTVYVVIYKSMSVAGPIFKLRIAGLCQYRWRTAPQQTLSLWLETLPSYFDNIHLNSFCSCLG